MGVDKALGRLCHHFCTPAASIEGESFGLAPSQAWHQGRDTQNMLSGGLSVARTLVWLTFAQLGEMQQTCSAYCHLSQIIPRFLRCPEIVPKPSKYPWTVPTPQMSTKTILTVPDVHSLHTYQMSMDGPQGSTEGPHIPQMPTEGS